MRRTVEYEETTSPDTSTHAHDIAHVADGDVVHRDNHVNPLALVLVVLGLLLLAYFLMQAFGGRENTETTPPPAGTNNNQNITPGGTTNPNSATPSAGN